MASPRCSFIVPIHNGLDYLRPMLDSLRAHTDLGPNELILSDDASGPATREFLRVQIDAKCRLNETNRGFAAACNAGAAVAQGDYLVFLNSDLEFRPGWLEPLVSAAKDPAVAAVGARLLYPDGTIQHGGVFLREDQLDRMPLIASHDRVGEPGDDPEANRRQSLLAVTAAALLVRREAFEAVGGFDEGYFNGYEDVDLCLKLRGRGLAVVYEPACVLIHHESKSGAGRFAASKANQRRFLEKWNGRVRPEVRVDPYLNVEPHPDARPEAPFYDQPCPVAVPRVRIVVTASRNVAALAATLESIFAARIGLGDRVVALLDPSDVDAMRYARLCEGFDDAFEWSADPAAAVGDEPYVAVLEPGTLATQGWLARLTRHLESTEADFVGPLLTGVSGPQDALGYLAPGSSGQIHPNELNHLFARNFPGAGIAASQLALYGFLARREAYAQSQRPVGACRIAQDVFVHREMRFVGERTPALAA